MFQTVADNNSGGILPAVDVCCGSGVEACTNTVVLTVRRMLQITSQSSDLAVYEGDTATFTVEAYGDGLTYQWWRRSPGWDHKILQNGTSVTSNAATLTVQ